MFVDQTINGLVIGNIYALIAIGIALIFGVGNLINFAQGSIFMVGAYVGWLCVTRLQMPLILAFAAAAVDTRIAEAQSQTTLIATATSRTAGRVCDMVGS